LCGCFSSPTGGQARESVPAPERIKGLQVEYVVADKGYDSNSLISHLIGQNVKLVIPLTKSRLAPREYDKHIYKERHFVACFFCKIKEYRRLATRDQKLTIFIG
jgi:transposase